MIRKPVEEERASRAHVTVGRAMDAASKAHLASASAGRKIARGYLTLLLTMMMLALLVSATPLWFKAIGLPVLLVLLRSIRGRSGSASQV